MAVRRQRFLWQQQRMLLGLGCALIGDRCSESSERSLRPDQSVSYRSSQCRRQLPPSAIRVETVLRNHRLDRLMPPSTTNKLTAFVQTCLARAREVTAGDGPPPTLGAGNPPLKTRDNPLPGQAPSSPAGVARNGRPSRGTDTSTRVLCAAIIRGSTRGKVWSDANTTLAGLGYHCASSPSCRPR
jgi:hypothetical protein